MWSTLRSTSLPDQSGSDPKAEPRRRARNFMANWKHAGPFAGIGLMGIFVAARIFKLLRKPKAATPAGLAGAAIATNATALRRDGLRYPDLINKGNFFTVRSAECALARKRIVCKEAHADADPKTLEQEFKVLTDLKGVDHVLQVIDYDAGAGKRAPPNLDAPQTLYVELLQGENLQEAMDRWNKTRSDPTKKEVIKIARQVAKGMSAVHEAGYAHRDLKPENIMRLPDGHIKIIDFGYAAKIDDEVAMAKVLGTAPFMAPEIGVKYLDQSFDKKKQNPYNEMVDVFAFGTLLWMLVTGKTAFANMLYKEILQAIALEGYRGSMKWIPPDRCGPKLETIIKECWEADPGSRPTFSAIVDRLNKI